MAGLTYLDANATEPLHPLAHEAVVAALALTGNPASVHSPGRAARRLLEECREQIATHFGAAPARLVFCSGGTEANVLAVRGLAAAGPVLIGATEHDAVRAAGEAMSVPVTADGRIDLAALERLLIAVSPSLVCLMLANNETGVIHPIAAAAVLCRRHRALLHVDAVQAAGRMAVTLAALGADSLALSSHKLGGPAGAGALLLSAAAAAVLQPMMIGGGQEQGRRGGTQNVAAIAGFAAAVRAPLVERAGLRDRLEQRAVGCGAAVAGGLAPRLGNTACLILPGVAAQTQLIALDLAGIAVSAGAACSSGKVGRSHVLAAMGLGEAADQAIRVSLPWNVTEADVERFGAAYADLARRTRLRA